MRSFVESSKNNKGRRKGEGKKYAIFIRGVFFKVLFGLLDSLANGKSAASGHHRLLEEAWRGGEVGTKRNLGDIKRKRERQPGWKHPRTEGRANRESKEVPQKKVISIIQSVHIGSQTPRTQSARSGRKAGGAKPKTSWGGVIGRAANGGVDIEGGGRNFTPGTKKDQDGKRAS